MSAMNNNQTFADETVRTPPKAAKDATTNSTSRRDPLKTPPPFHITSPPGAPRQRIVSRSRDKYRAIFPEQSSSYRSGYANDQQFGNKIDPLALQDGTSKPRHNNGRYLRRNDGLETGALTSEIQFPGQSEAHASSTLAQSRVERTSVAPDASKNEEPFCEVKKAKQGEEEKFSLTPTAANSTPQTPSRDMASMNEVPTTPTNSYAISPPKAPRPQRVMRPEEVWERNREPSTPSRTQTNLKSRSGPRAFSERDRLRDSRSRSPPRDRSLDRSLPYRSRSPTNNIRRRRIFSEAAFGAKVVKPSNQGAPINNKNPSDEFDISALYWNKLSLADPEHNENTAINTSSKLLSDEFGGMVLNDSGADAFHKMGKAFRDEERGFR
ncbi:hypothetical protein NHQ30_007018 [Ciborinia camelliae]|nr:hypothetical protein NHQ30_007018 [Ciborinia camelliae]